MQIRSQEMLEKFMRKSKHKEKIKQESQNKITNNVSNECLVVSEKVKKNRLTEIIDSLRLEHLNTEEKKAL